MKFTETTLPGAWLVDLELREDERGFFARSWCANEFKMHGLNSDLVQCNISFNRLCGTLRGMHYQQMPHGECKLVRCTRGAIFDVIVDLRKDSATLKRWWGFELSAENRTALYIPEGFAHGFQTLTDDAEVFYQMSCEFHGPSATGVRWNDPAFGIDWPLPVRSISEKDQAWPDCVG